MRARTKLTAGVLAAFLSLAAVGCEGGTAEDPAGDPGADPGAEPGADPGADLPADDGTGDL
jgi:hypothetical protein